MGWCQLYVCVCAVRGAGGKRVGQFAAVREGDVM